MIHIKKQIFNIIVFTLLHASSALTMDGENTEEFWQQYLVHTSAVMSDNATKIAGARLAKLHIKNSAIHKDWSLDSPQDSIRRRITLHHCIGGVVPAASHGITVKGLGSFGSDIYRDKDMYSFLEPLSEFRGEIIGGIYEDVMTTDRHVYGKKSVAVVPSHRLKEFHKHNPNYLGEVVGFDADAISIKEKVDQVLKIKSPGFSLQEQFQGLLADFSTTSLYSFYDTYEQHFRKNHLTWEMHNLSYFKALEYVLSQLARDVRAARKKDKTILIAADQIPAYMATITVLSNLILHDVAHRLNEEKAFALMNWLDDIRSWLNIFELEYLLRTKRHTSMFLDNPQFDEFVRHRNDQNHLIKLSHSLMELKEERLNLTSDRLLDSAALEIAEHLEMPRLLELRDGLIKAGFADYGHAMVLARLFTERSDKLYSELDAHDSKISNVLRSISSSPKFRATIRPFVKALIFDDESFQNKNALAFLNSETGALVQYHLFGSSRLCTFDDLLRNVDETAILFANLDDELIAKRYMIEPFQIHFIKIVRAWMLERVQNASARDTTVAGDKLNFSLANIKTAYNSIIEPLERYKFGSYKIGFEPGHPWEELIEQGCFISLTDIYYRSVPMLEKLNVSEREVFEGLFDDNLYHVYISVTKYLANKHEGFAPQEAEVFARIEELEQHIRAYISDDQAGYDLSWKKKLKFLVNGQLYSFIKHSYPIYTNSQITYVPNLALAWALYHKLQRALAHDANMRERFKPSHLRYLARIMKNAHAMVPLNNETL